MEGGICLWYQVPKKATGAVQGTAMEKVNWMARVEKVATHLDNGQSWFIVRYVEDPSKLGDIMPIGFGEAGVIQQVNGGGEEVG